jgi:hypothetical protein
MEAETLKAMKKTTIEKCYHMKTINKINNIINQWLHYLKLFKFIRGLPKIIRSFTGYPFVSSHSKKGKVKKTFKGILALLSFLC